MSAACPSDVALERLLLERGEPEVRSHAERCPECARRLAAMREEGEAFRRFVYPSSVERIEDAARRAPRRRVLLALLPVPLLATAAAVALVVVPRPQTPDYLGLKGGDGVGLTLFAPGGAAPRILADGAEVGPRATLRFRVRTSAPCRLFLLSVDGAGEVSRLDGAGPDGLALTAGQHDLAGGVQLDAGPGPERFFAVCVPGGTRAAEIERAAQAVGREGEAGVRRGKRLNGLPTGAIQATQLVEKRP
jgi:hypothetical protein